MLIPNLICIAFYSALATLRYLAFTHCVRFDIARRSACTDLFSGVQAICRTLPNRPLGRTCDGRGGCYNGFAYRLKEELEIKEESGWTGNTPPSAPDVKC